MGINRIVDTTFWTDGKVDDFTPEDKYFFLYLLTNPFTSQLGIYEISIKQAAFQMGYSTDAVISLIDRFENKYKMIFFSKATNEIAVKNFLRHSIVKGGAPVRDCLIKEMRKVKNKELIAKVFRHIKGSEGLNETVAKIVKEYEEKNGCLNYSNNKRDLINEKDNDNDNENENEVSYHDSYNDSYHDTSPTHKVFGSFSNVYLDDKQLARLKEECPLDYERRIERLSKYIASSGKTYDNHLAVILRWAEEEYSYLPEGGV